LANDLYSEALSKAEDEEYDEALALLAEARQAAPDHIGLYLTAAQILASEREDYAAAEALLAQAGGRRPGAPRVACARADLQFQRGECEAAEREFRSVAGVAEVSELARAGVARSLVARSRRLMGRGRHDQALPLLEEANSWEDTAAAHLNQGIC